MGVIWKECGLPMEPIHEGGEAEGQFAPADRDSSVMRVIGEEDLHGFTFEGLKRKLGIHSETLSRILARLEDQDFLAKTENGYVVTDRGRYLTGTSRTGHQTSGIVLLSTLLPAYQNGRVVSGLMGRWFGPLRWLGYSKEEDGMTLKWITEGGRIQVDAIFSQEELVIEGRIMDGEDLSAAVAASHQLVGYISRLYDQGHQRPHYQHPDSQGVFDN